ncbi:MAG: NAD(P)H-hydrate dehydratase [Clostridia bacterium]
MKQVVNALTMAQSDKFTIENLGVSAYDLMKKAGEAIFASYDFKSVNTAIKCKFDCENSAHSGKKLPCNCKNENVFNCNDIATAKTESVENCENSNIAIVCGKGNNGGDGFALANVFLDNAIFNFSVFYIDGKRSPESEAFFASLNARGFKNLHAIDENFTFINFNVDVIVDCLLGTGLTNAPTGLYKVAINAINNAKTLNSNAKPFIISADIPSGLNGSNGLATGEAVKSDLTVCINTLKSGLLLNDGKDYAKNYVVCDIGIKIVGESYSLFTAQDAQNILPKRPNNCHKNTFGKLAIIGGCNNYIGATKLATKGATAVASGVGIVKLCVAKSIAKYLFESVEECTLFSLPDNGGNLLFDKEQIDLALSDCTAVVIGVGIGRSEDIINIIYYIISNYNLPVIIDADGLNALANDVKMLRSAKAQIILTPHPKEFCRLSGLSVNAILQNPIETAQNFAKEYNCVVLLKGCATVVTNGKDVLINTAGCANMAKGGSGDVLSGVIGAIMAQGANAMDGAILGAYICGKAGELAKKQYCEVSATPLDTINNIKFAIKEIINN